MCLEAVPLPSEAKEHLARFFQSQVSPPDHCQRVGARLFLLHGPAGVGKKFTAEALCQSVGMPLLIADVPQMLRESTADLSCVPRLFREALLQSAAVHLITPMGCWRRTTERCVPGACCAMRVEFRAIALIGRNNRGICRLIPYGQPRSPFLPTIGHASNSGRHRVGIGRYHMASDVHLSEVAERFRFTAGQIRQALAQRSSVPDTRSACPRNLGGRSLSCPPCNESEATLAQNHPALYLRDIIPPQDQAELREIRAHAGYRQKCLSSGFNRKMSLARLSMFRWAVRRQDDGGRDCRLANLARPTRSIRQACQ
jgi:hypothetical protein